MPTIGWHGIFKGYLKLTTDRISVTRDSRGLVPGAHRRSVEGPPNAAGARHDALNQLLGGSSCAREDLSVAKATPRLQAVLRRQLQFSHARSTVAAQEQD